MSRFRLVAATLFVCCLFSGCTELGTGGGGPSPDLFDSCESLQTDATVQQALTVLFNGGEEFTFFSGSTPPSIDGGWEIVEGRVTFTDAGPANITFPGGLDRFASGTPASTLSWLATRDNGVSLTSLRGFINGTQAGFTVCLLADVAVTGAGNQVTCRARNAVFYSLVLSADGQELAGSFLNVVLARQTGGTTCLDAGNFEFGSIQFRRVDLSVPVIEPRGTISLGVSTPTSVTVTRNGTLAYVGTAGGSVIRADLSTGATALLTLPQPNGFTGVGPIGVSSEGADVGFATTGDTRLLSYSVQTASGLQAHIVPPQTPSQGEFLPQAPVYTSGSTTGYAAVDFVNLRPALGVFSPLSGGAQVVLNATVPFNQEGLGLIRMRRDSGQIAAILAGAEPAGEARFVGLVNAATDTLTREVDVQSATFASFHDDQLHYSVDGTRVFVANDAGILAIGTSGAFSVVPVALAEAAEDSTRHLAVSDDGDALAVTIASGAGRSNFVVLTQDLLELHRASELGASVGAGGNLLFFPGTRIVVVEDGQGHVTPFNTAAPFSAGETLNAFAGLGTPDIAGSGVGGRTLVVANRSERVLYLFRLTIP